MGVARHQSFPAGVFRWVFFAGKMMMNPWVDVSFKEGIQVDQTWPSSLIVRESLILGSSGKKKLFVWSTGLLGYTYMYISKF